METYTMPLDSLTGEIQCCIVKASLVVDPFHIAVAANKAVLREHHHQLTTKSVFTEILYVMSSSSNISLALTKFGIHDNDKNIVVVTIHAKDDGEALEKQIERLIVGHAVPISRMDEFTDKMLVKKIYKIDDDELKVSSLLYSVVSRVGSDYAVSLK